MSNNRQQENQSERGWGMRQEPCRKLHGFSESMCLLTVTRSLRLIGLGEEWDEEDIQGSIKQGLDVKGQGRM